MNEMRKSSKIHVENANVFYGSKHSLHSVSMDIQPNTITAFIGPSGCGKSTFLRCLNRMNDLVENCRVEGDFYIDQIPIYSDVDLNQLRKQIGMVFQKPNPFPMSIFDNVAYGPRTHGIKNKNELEEIVIQALKQAALYDEVKDDLNKSALALSGGQQQRLCIARALAVHPDVLLMDEPTSALDPISTAKIEDLCLQLKKDYTVVIVTHNLNQAKRIADQTAFFFQGDLIEAGPTWQIFNEASSPKTRDYITGRFG